MSPPRRPPFSSLPLNKDGPPMNAWGLYGANDELGAINMLTPAVVKAAASEEIRTGERVSLDWNLDMPKYPSFGRPPFQWHMHHKQNPDGSYRTVNDDFLNVNTQGSSQWDGFRHYGYQKADVYYGGRKQEELEAGEVIGINKVVEAGGITTRAVVLDYPRWLARKGKAEVNAISASSISADVLQEMLKDTGLTPREGDLLLLRTGFTAAYTKLSEDDKKALANKPPTFLGVESSKPVLQWIWESGFVAVAGDAPSFEMSPLVGNHNEAMWKGESWGEEMKGGGLVHQWLLAGWGVMIGEMWDLEKLCDKCEKEQRWTCFVSSVPLKVPGGVASPPNAVAIF